MNSYPNVEIHNNNIYGIATSSTIIVEKMTTIHTTKNGKYASIQKYNVQEDIHTLNYWSWLVV